MQKALVRFGLIGISSNSSLVVPGILTVIDGVSKLIKELMGKTGLNGFSRGGFGSNNLRADSENNKQGVYTCSLITVWTCKAYKPLFSEIIQKLGDELVGQVSGHQTYCLFLGVNIG